MASAASSDFVRHGKYQIPVAIWGLMQGEFRRTIEGSDVQIGSDLSGSTCFDWTLDGELPASDPNMSRLAEIRKGVKAIGAEALNHDDQIEQWLITSNVSRSPFAPKRHNKGFKDRKSINKFVDGFKSSGSTPLAETLQAALSAYVNKVTKDPGAKALTLVWFLDGVDDNMEGLNDGTVNLEPLKDLVMDAAAEIKAITKCADVRDKLGVQFCLVTSYSKVIHAYDGFDNATTYKYAGTEAHFECDIFDCTTIKQVMEMGGWESPLTHMKLIGGARNETLDNILEYLKEHALDYDPASGGNPPTYDECMDDLDRKRKEKAGSAI
ncbi:hypothetical protein GGS24DRAFT_472355 [Hypoxylon argillaceum]|nr:hypothetical protein GGS24DRAFT_472355 [Hypoxylon argillaceum]